MPYKDENTRKLKHAEYSRNYYEKNRSKVIASSKSSRATGKAKWDAFKRTLKCAQCGFDHPAALDFHHVNPAKKENIVSALVSSGKFAAAMKEVSKCIVLCANHHRVLHYEELKPTSNQICR